MQWLHSLAFPHRLITHRLRSREWITVISSLLWINERNHWVVGFFCFCFLCVCVCLSTQTCFIQKTAESHKIGASVISLHPPFASVLDWKPTAAATESLIPPPREPPSRELWKFPLPSPSHTGVSWPLKPVPGTMGWPHSMLLIQLRCGLLRGMSAQQVQPSKPT